MALARAKLTNDVPGGEVVFDFNPSQILFNRTLSKGTSERGSASENAGFPGGATGFIFGGADMPEIRLQKVLFDGEKTQEYVEQLSKWMSPIGSSLLGALASKAIGAAASALGSALGIDLSMNLAAKMPLVVFKWGDGFEYECNVASARMTYARFEPTGKPTRAEGNITLKEAPSLFGLLPTNPTSGGPAGRRSHIVTAGENIQSVADKNYGMPGYWRALAEANGIDDPMRVQPGQRVFLPNPEELIRARRG